MPVDGFWVGITMKDVSNIQKSDGVISNKIMIKPENIVAAEFKKIVQLNI